MKTLRILGAIIGTAALIGMFSCGGSSFLTDAPLGLWDQDSVVVRFQAMGLDAPDASSGQTGLSKAFFSDGTFTGNGQLDGEGLFQYLEVDCKLLFLDHVQQGFVVAIS